MIMVDATLKPREAAGKPVCVGMFGAGVMARSVAIPIVNPAPGSVESCARRRTLPRDTVLAQKDLKGPEGRPCDRLRRKQDRHFLG